MDKEVPPNLPLVSVIIPAYNAERFIQTTLNSVLGQTYKHIEVLVVDDGSQDKTVEIVNSIAQKDPRVVLLRQPNSGVADARNLAIKKSKGLYIAPIDADDIWEPQNLEKQVQCLLGSEPSVGVVYAWSVDIDEEGLLTGGFYNSTLEGNVYLALLYKQFLGNASASVIRHECFDKVGGYNPNLKLQNAQGCEDWELYLRIAEHYEFRVVPEYLVGYRQINSSMSRNYASMAKSHDLVLIGVQQRNPEIGAYIYRWSKSNFYRYLAFKSNGDGNYKSSFFWLWQALMLDFSMTLTHHNFYLLLINILLKFIQERVNILGKSILDKATALSPEVSSNARRMTMVEFTWRIKVHKLLPATIYERIRFVYLAKQRKIEKPIDAQMAALGTSKAS